MKLFKIKSLVLATFLFQPFLALANGQGRSCRSAFENPEARGIVYKDIKSVPKDLDRDLWNVIMPHYANLTGDWYLYERKEFLKVIEKRRYNATRWGKELFEMEQSPLELAKSIEKALSSDKYESFQRGEPGYLMLEHILNNDRKFIPEKELIYDTEYPLALPMILSTDSIYPLMQYLTFITGAFHSSDLPRRTALIEAMYAENSKLVAIFKGLGADVYTASPYNAEILSMMRDRFRHDAEVLSTMKDRFAPFFENNELVHFDDGVIKIVVENNELVYFDGGIIKTERNPNDFRIKYPIPLALERFSAQTSDREANRQIVELLLDSSNPNFRYDHSHLDKRFGLLKIKYQGDPKIDRDLIYGVRDGASDLMLVAQYGTPDMLKSLLEKGHDVTARDKEGWGVANYAQLNRQHREEILALLREYITGQTVELSE